MRAHVKEAVHGMDPLASISVTVETSSVTTGNVLPILHELRHALQRLRTDHTEHIIDLSSLPMAAEEYLEIEQLLGHGEIHARLQALGESTISETAIPGIWSIVHMNADKAVVGRFLEITDCPAILKTQAQDLENGIAQLAHVIDLYS